MKLTKYSLTLAFLGVSLATAWGQAAEPVAAAPANGLGTLMTYVLVGATGLVLAFTLGCILRANQFLYKRLLRSAVSVLALVLAATTVWGQAPAAGAAAPTAKGWSLGDIMTTILITGIGALSAVALLYMVRVNQFLYKRVLSLEAARHNVDLPQFERPVAETIAPEESMWTRLRKKYWENAVPLERENEIILHHEYDGIRELDNSLPPWWVNMFILTTIWAAIYMVYYHFGGGGPSSGEEYKREMDVAKKEQAVALAGKANAVDEATVLALTEAPDLTAGASIYNNSCVACHGQKGEGSVGPNLTDPYWIHGGGIKNVFKTIKYGVPEKGMIAWQSQLKPADIQKVASYILTLQGTNPPNAKEAQGELWKDVAPGDSTKQANTLSSTTE
jgi:cytochrome c oxidase cbb3-type subunit 3